MYLKRKNDFRNKKASSLSWQASCKFKLCARLNPAASAPDKGPAAKKKLAWAVYPDFAPDKLPRPCPPDKGRMVEHPDKAGCKIKFHFCLTLAYFLTYFFTRCCRMCTCSKSYSHALLTRNTLVSQWQKQRSACPHPSSTSSPSSHCIRIHLLTLRPPVIRRVQNNANYGSLLHAHQQQVTSRS